MKLLFASHNQHKLEEVRSILLSKGLQGIELISLSDLGDEEEIPENGETLEENALQKAREVWRRYHIPCFADDTGLEVRALDGAPGVYSARYAGSHCSAEDNVDKLLRKLQDKEDREAQFRTVIALILDDGEEHLFEGEVAGEILRERRGAGGFGYDPIFLPAGKELSFSEMTLEEKNGISHRYEATLSLSIFLEKLLKA